MEHIHNNIMKLRESLGNVPQKMTSTTTTTTNFSWMYTTMGRYFRITGLPLMNNYTPVLDPQILRPTG
jgi:hypothetical protein